MVTKTTKGSVVITGPFIFSFRENNKLYYEKIIIQGGIIMNERNAQIENFLEKWNEMLVAANQIDGFKYQFEVTIHSDNSLIEDRVKTINGINESFTRNNMTWTSSND